MLKNGLFYCVKSWLPLQPHRPHPPPPQILPRLHGAPENNNNNNSNNNNNNNNNNSNNNNDNDLFISQ